MELYSHLPTASYDSGSFVYQHWSCSLHIHQFYSQCSWCTPLFQWEGNKMSKYWRATCYKLGAESTLIRECRFLLWSECYISTWYLTANQNMTRQRNASRKQHLHLDQAYQSRKTHVVLKAVMLAVCVHYFPDIPGCFSAKISSHLISSHLISLTHYFPLSIV